MKSDELAREVAGIRCREVLELLSAYVDGELPAEDVARVETHVRGCDRCERFGGRFGGAIAALRRELERPALLDPSLVARLRTRLETA